MRLIITDLDGSLIDHDTYSAEAAWPALDAARAAGAAPVHRGDPGYGSHLDREGDGIGCE